MTETLAKVRRAASRRRTATAAYHAALIEARQTHTLQEIGDVLGISRQAVRQALLRANRKEEA